MGLSRILGHSGTRKAYDVLITYEDGSTGKLHVFADEMRDALTMASYWLPLHLPARSLTITERVK